MLKLIIKKTKNKIWLTICLVLGMSFLVTIFCCLPMFKAGSMNKLLEKSFVKYIEDNNQYPTVIGDKGYFSNSDCADVSGAMDELSKSIDALEKNFEDIDVIERQTIYEFNSMTSQGSYGSKGNYLNVTYVPKMEEHIIIAKGEGYDTYDSEDGVYPCVISEKVMDEFGLVTGEVINFVSWENGEGKTLKLVISGIFKESDKTDLFWRVSPYDLEKNVFVSEDIFKSIASNYDYNAVTYKHFSMLDYTDIDSSNVNMVEKNVKKVLEDENKSASFVEILDKYQAEKKTVDIILWVLELPIIGMVLAFIYMVAKQIVETERDEIAMLKSRGFSKGQIVCMYGVQSGLLGIFSFALGLPLGYILCKMAASTTDFLTFSMNDIGAYRFVPSMLLYGLVATIIGIAFILIPVILSTNISIVESKSGSRLNKNPAWKKFFFDIILLVISIYLLYNFNQDKESISQKAIAGNKMDPMIFLDAFIFIIGFGLLTLRLTHYLVKLVYFLGKKKWKPAMYASFLQITRTTYKQGFISVFLILTVSLGLFNANTARTINRNNEERIQYEIGADGVIKERWERKIYNISRFEKDYEYSEPDYNRFEGLVSSGICQNVTRVIRDDKATVFYGTNSLKKCVILMGINTKEFGQTAYLKEELNSDVHWFNYLNALAEKPNGVIISSNLAEALGRGVGDVIKCSRDNEILGTVNDVRGEITLEICAIVDNWPGYNRYYYENGELKENYLAVANYADVVRAFRISPYQVWVKLADGMSWDRVEEYIRNCSIDTDYIMSEEKEIADMKSTPLIQITNGMFTMSFIIALVLCTVGFLIYWISSIRQRELLFGVYRAMGMSVKSINKMLINEHIFSTFLSVLAGGGVGMLATALFVKLFGIVYLPKKHNLDIYIYFEVGDVIKLATIIVLMIVVCILILRKLIKSLNITQALKMGEE